MEQGLYVKELYIEGFKKFSEPVRISLKQGMNVLVGNNDFGKSTILEALHLVLTGTFRGRSLNQALTQDLFNIDTVGRYFDTLRSGHVVEPPCIRIEATFDGADTHELAKYEGDNNVGKAPASGVGILIELDRDEFGPEFDEYVKGLEGNALPIEYYHVKRYTFSRHRLVASTLGFRSCLIDSSGNARSGSQQSYISHLAKDVLDCDDQIAVLQAYRQTRVQFDGCDAVVNANSLLSDKVSSLTGKKVSFRSDMGNKQAWESGVVAALDSIAFAHAGAGSQNMAEVELALAKSGDCGSGVILLEEPEAHLSHANLNALLEGVCERLGGQQALVSTHSSFVANKLNLGNLLIVGPDGNAARLSDTCDSATFRFFEKLPGYSTLRFLLCRAAILVEGDSDELVVQRAYMDSHKGRLPIQEGIEVISVANSAQRFLQMAKVVSQPVVALTDNDGDVDKRRSQYGSYWLLCDGQAPIDTRIAVSFPGRCLERGPIEDYSYNTLEPELFKANGLQKTGVVLGKAFKDRDAALRHMKTNKTECAYKFFTTDEDIVWPEYIVRAIEFIDAALGRG